MAVLAQLEPKAVFHYFEEICGIPHESSDTQAISHRDSVPLQMQPNNR